MSDEVNAHGDLERRLHDARQTIRRLRLTLDSLTDALYTLDRDWRFTYVNDRACELLGRTPEELIGKNLWEEYPDAADSGIYPTYHRLVESGEIEEIAEFHYPPLNAWYRVVLNPSEHGLSVYFHDITADREAREALRAREAESARQAALLDEATDAIMVWGLDHRITYWNRGAERIYGWTAAEANGCDIRTLIHEDLARFEQANAAVIEQGFWAGEFVLQSRSGDHLVVAARWSLLRDDEGRPEAVLGINTDVSEQRRVEFHLARAQRLESIGTLAGGVAHDLNNVLSPILLASEMLQVDETDPERSELIAMIVDSARRGGDLVAQVLSFARGVEGDRVPVEIAEMLRQVHAMLRETFPKNITVRVEIQDGIGSVVGDHTQIQQVLLNLAVNARDAMPDGGTLTISAATVDLDMQYLVSVDGIAPGKYVLIEVEDNGAGMAPEVLDRVFEPFFTTKEQGAGTGLGLSTSAGIVQSHGGFLRAYSEFASGSRFRVYLPTAPVDEPTTHAVPAGREPIRGNGETILVVDDEPAIRQTTRRTLEGAGYLVIEAGNGAEAVAAFARADGQVELVLIDMMMPIMDGPTTIHALRTLSPEVRIVAASGLHGNGKTNQALGAGVSGFLSKPYTSVGLLQAVADALAD